MSKTDQFSLDEKYKKEEGRIILSGIQALVRLPLDQHKADKKAGLNTATFISGYRGSPLGGLDSTLIRSKQLLDQHQVTFLPGVNEDLGATAVYGSQIANALPNPKYDGVLGMWYGKAPGVDRSGDIFKHANIAGVGRYGGVLAIAGDDPVSKSSTLPSHSEAAFYDAQIPVLYPGNVQEILKYGRLGFELSRYSGLWVGMKVVTDIADGFGTADITPIDHIEKPSFTYNGKPWEHTQNPTLLPVFSLQLEKELYEARLKAVSYFAHANNLNEITVRSNTDSIGLIAAGKTYYDMLEALELLGLDESTLKSSGIRILKLGLIYPIEPKIVNEFADGLEEIFVVEEKRGFIETMVRSVLYNVVNNPIIVGKEDEGGNPLVPAYNELVVKDLIPILFKRLEAYMSEKLVKAYEQQASRSMLSLPMTTSEMVARTPYFCSGCPHNTSTVVPEGSLSGGGIGCHGLVLAMDRNTIGLLHMGGEGVPWVGAAPFSETNHMFQNIGDGTLFHSGYLAIRQAIAANVNITYKILYNSAVAMTGGQPADGSMSVPDLTRALEAEGVKEIIVCADDPKKYSRGAQWAHNVKLWHRDSLQDAQLQLREVDGVTIIIYDQPCAADIRRKRKRGLAPTPKKRIFINEAVCEGCGDCGEKSNCLSVFPVETEFGRKTQIHQSSCNLDYTCLKGDCPAFVTIEVKDNETKRQIIPLPDDLLSQPIPTPQAKVGANANLYLTGIGGTGVVTVTQIIATAALLDGKVTYNLDQTGLSQKGGPVVSHIKIRESPQPIANRIAHGQADGFIVFDLLNGATEKNLEYTNTEKTIAIISTSQVPTGSMVKSTQVQFPEEEILLTRVQMNTRKEDNTYLDAVYLAENLFGSHMPANMITMGAAYQAGVVPISLEAIMDAIELNGVAVMANKQAFTVGRLTVSDPSNWLDKIQLKRQGSLDELRSIELSLEQEKLLEQNNFPEVLLDPIKLRLHELTEYQDLEYASTYIEFVKKVYLKEKDLNSTFPLTDAVVRYLYKLMAYKDEYEVARLYLKTEFEEELISQFGSDFKLKYQLHPPLLRSLGWNSKIGFGRWFKLGYKLLYRMRKLRGSRWDLFGYAKIRKTERFLITEYMDIISKQLEFLSNENISTLVTVAELPDLIRGYEHVKEKNIEKYSRELDRLLNR